MRINEKIIRMLFKQKHLEGIKAGKVTLAFRRWKRTDLKKGSLIKTAVGTIEITDIATIKETHINDIDAKKAGFINLDSLLKSLHSEEEARIFKMHIRNYIELARPKATEKSSLSKGDINKLKAKLTQFDKYSRSGAWTNNILKTLHENPKATSTELSLKTGKTREWLQLNIRKLKNLGLTVNHDPGYELTKIGKMLMEHLL